MEEPDLPPSEMLRRRAADKRPWFPSLTDVQAWADANGGEAAVREWLAEEKFAGFGPDRMPVKWLHIRDLENQAAHAAATLNATERAAAAAERSARFALLGVVVSAVALIVAALAYLNGPH